MNQYPAAGFMPMNMMMQQPYMVAVRLPPGMPHPTRAAGQLGAAGQIGAGQLAGAGQLTTAQHAQLAMAGQLGTGQLTAAGQLSASQLAAAGQLGAGQLAGQLGAGQLAGQLTAGQIPGVPGQPGAAFLPAGLPLSAAGARFATPPPTSATLSSTVASLTGTAPLNVLSPTPPTMADLQSLHLSGHLAGQKLAFGSVLAGMGYGAEQMIATPDLKEYGLLPNPEEVKVTLDEYASDLNLVIDDDGYGAYPMTNPSGFCFCWAGTRASHGVVRGKVYYEVQITEHLPTDFGEDHQETNPHVIRVGWSIDSSSFQLGEEPYSYGYGGTAKFSTNNKFQNYGEKFGEGDVIGALLDMDAHPPTISYTKNGQWLGVACTLRGFNAGTKEFALYPHILSKNTRFHVNFGQEAPVYPAPQGFMYIAHYPEKYPGAQPPEKKSDCEIIMIIGLPGAGKTTWGIKMAKEHPEKRYNIIGTDTLIDKMKVMGLPRKNNYHGRWDVLIDKATKCLNKLFETGSKRCRNYILDQTNVYPSARKRKIKNFHGFYRIGAVLQPEDPELLRRSEKRTVEDGKFVPESAVLEMKANFKLPLENDDLFDRLDYVELQRDKCVSLVERYNQEGQANRQPKKGGAFGRDNRPFQPPADLRQGQQNFQGSSNQFDRFGGQDRNAFQGQGRQENAGQFRGGFQADQGAGNYRGRYDAQVGEPPAKNARFDSSGASGSALDLLKQEYAEEEQPQSQYAVLHTQSRVQQAQLIPKQEPPWNRADYGAQLQFTQQKGLDAMVMANMVGLKGAGQAVPALFAGQQFAAYGERFDTKDVAAVVANQAGGDQNFFRSAASQPPPPPPDQPTAAESSRGGGWQGKDSPGHFQRQGGSDSFGGGGGGYKGRQEGGDRNDQGWKNQNQWQQQQSQQSGSFGGQSAGNRRNRDEDSGFGRGMQQFQRQSHQEQSGSYESQFGSRGRQDNDSRQFGNKQESFGRQNDRNFNNQDSRNQFGGQGSFGRGQQGFEESNFDNSRSGSILGNYEPEKNSYGTSDSGSAGRPGQEQSNSSKPSYSASDSGSGDKPKRERRRPSKWDTPSDTPPADSAENETSSPSSSQAESSQKSDSGKMQSGGQRWQQNKDDQFSSDFDNKFDNKQFPPGGPGEGMGNQRGFQGHDRQGGGRFGGPRDDDRQGDRPMGGFGGRGGFGRGGMGGPQPLMGGPRGPPNQRPPFRPRGPGGLGGPGGPGGLGGPGGPGGMGGPGGPGGLGGPGGPGGPDIRFQGRGGMRPFRPRNPFDQGGMRGPGGRPPFGGPPGPGGPRGGFNPRGGMMRGPRPGGPPFNRR